MFVIIGRFKVIVIVRMRDCVSVAFSIMGNGKGVLVFVNVTFHQSISNNKHCSAKHYNKSNQIQSGKLFVQ